MSEMRNGRLWIPENAFLTRLSSPISMPPPKKLTISRHVTTSANPWRPTSEGHHLSSLPREIPCRLWVSLHSRCSLVHFSWRPSSRSFVLMAFHRRFTKHHHKSGTGTPLALFTEKVSKQFMGQFMGIADNTFFRHCTVWYYYGYGRSD